MAFVAGGLSVLALAPFFLWPVLLLTLPVLVWRIDGAAGAARPIRAAALAGWWFGFGYFLFGLFWVGEAFLVEAEKFGWALPFAVTLMPAGLALFWAAAAGLSRRIWWPGLARIFVLAVTLGLAEWLRGHVLSGFPWNVLGYALTAPDVLMQSAGLVGVYGLSLWTVVMFAAPIVLASDGASGEERRRGALRGAAIFAVPLLCLAGYGAVQLSGSAQPMIAGVKLRIVQPAIPQREKWKPENQGPIFRDHLDLSARNAAGERVGFEGVTHVIWPEAAMPFLPLEHPEAVSLIGETLPDDVALIAGALRRERAEDTATGWRAYNSLMVFDGAGRLQGQYDKTHLVPFGEYLPLQGVLERVGLEQLTRMRGGFTEGPEPRPNLKVQGLPEAGGLICYEAIFPGVGRRAERRPEFLLNVTNDGWFGNTTGPRQHFHQARVRAVEEGLSLVRAANNGISAVVDAKGRVLTSLSLNARGVVESGLPGPGSRPMFVLFGDYLFVVQLAIVLGMAVFCRPRSSVFSSRPDG